MHPPRSSHFPFIALPLLLGCGAAPPAAPSPSASPPTTEEVPAERVLTGVVRDSRGPVAGARVRIKGRDPVVLTNRAGAFRLPAGVIGEADRVTAAKEGYYIAGVPAAEPGTIHLTPLPEHDFEQYAWVSPHADPHGAHNCANCHHGIYEQWRQGGHARSASNRRFLNLHAGRDWHGREQVGWSLKGEHPLGVGVCAACHAPSAELNDPGIEQPERLAVVAADGVHCDFCHKIREVPQDALGLTHGRYAVELLRPREGQLFFGPLDDVDRGDDAFSPVHLESRFCAACHEGVVFGAHVYGTFTEWLASPAARQGKSCQTCHFAGDGITTNLAPGHGGIERNPATLSRHGLFGESRLTMLARGVEVRVLPRFEDGVVAVEVATRDVGHRTPTGFVDRHLLLVVEAFDKENRLLPLQSGESLPPAAGEPLAGRAGRLFAKVLHDAEGNWPIPFWRSAGLLRDTRLQPERTWRGEFTFPSPIAQARVRLLHRRFWIEAAREKSWPDDTLTLHDLLLRRPVEE